ncbi:MAG: hypothetical protein VCD34_09455 [Planctomycetota bacterium]
MDSTDFVFLSLVCTGLVLLASIFVGTGSNRDAGKRPTAGWKKFTVRPGTLLDGVGRGPVVSSTDSGGGELEVLSGGNGSFPIKIGHRRHGPLIVIEKPMISLKPILRMSLLGTPWLQIHQDRKNGFPRLVGAGRRMPEEVPEAGTIEFVGEIASREYEIRLRDKLAAAVFLDDEPGNEPAGDGSYRVALPENIAELPLLALVIGLEVELATRRDAVKA